jgi:hypothetical protein
MLVSSKCRLDLLMFQTTQFMMNFVYGVMFMSGSMLRMDALLYTSDIFFSSMHEALFEPYLLMFQTTPPYVWFSFVVITGASF